MASGRRGHPVRGGLPGKKTTARPESSLRGPSDAGLRRFRGLAVNPQITDRSPRPGGGWRKHHVPDAVIEYVIDGLDNRNLFGKTQS